MEDINENAKYKLSEAATILSNLSGDKITYRRLHTYVQNGSLKKSRSLGNSIRISGADLKQFYQNNFS